MSESIKELAKRLRYVMDDLDELAKKKSVLYKEYEDLRKVQIPEAMEELGLDNVKITDVGRISLRSDLYATIPGDHKEEAYSWLMENGFGGIVKDYVQPSTMKAFCKEQIKEGVELPDDLFKVTPYTMAALTRT